LGVLVGRQTQRGLKIIAAQLQLHAGHHFGLEGLGVSAAFATYVGQLIIGSSAHVSTKSEVDTMVSG